MGTAKESTPTCLKHHHILTYRPPDLTVLPNPLFDPILSYCGVTEAMCFDQQKVVHFSMLSTLFQALVLLLIEYWVLSYSSFLLSHEGEVKISTSLSPTIQDLIDMK